ncbi:MAG: hypothetical protein Q4C82_09275 [Eubacteriales bacterium]|nr:hypothetical protein [Eubacteriales bacterium]
MKKIKKIILMATAIVLLLPGKTAFAKNNMVPDYEVKLFLDSGLVLNSDNELKKTYRNMFDTGKDYTKITVAYADTEDLAFNLEGWTNRIRVKEDASEFELTYKKRYSISNNDIDEALNRANIEGFDKSDTNYEAQIDWGYHNMTLSLSRKKTVSNKGYDDLELPKKSRMLAILKDEMPGKEQDWKEDGWGTSLITDAKKFGDVQYKKYGGTYEGIDIDIEIWEIRGSDSGIEYITELSFKEDTYEEAAEKRSTMINALDSMGILLHEDSLKTQKILNSY